MEKFKNFNLIEIDKNEALNTFGGMNPAEWIMYKAGQLKYKVSHMFDGFGWEKNLPKNPEDFHLFS